MVNFRKRIKIIPGVRLNVSKGGISTSVGVKGASVTTGKNGTYANTGIPGTGLYSRKKISGSRRDSAEQQPDLNVADSEGLEQAQALIENIRIGLEGLELQHKNVVLLDHTFDIYLYGIISNILTSMGVNIKSNVSKSTNCVLFGGRKAVPKYLLQNIAVLEKKGADVTVYRLTLCEDSTPDIVITRIETEGIDISKYSKTMRILRILLIVVFSFLALIIMIVALT